jgi:hypothetical protein
MYVDSSNKNYLFVHMYVYLQVLQPRQCQVDEEGDDEEEEADAAAHGVQGLHPLVQRLLPQ